MKNSISKSLRIIAVALMSFICAVLSALLEETHDTKNTPYAPAAKRALRAAGEEQGAFMRSLHDAAERGDVEYLKRLLREKLGVIDLDDMSVHGTTPLYKAVEKGRESAVRLLISHDAQTNVSCMYRCALLTCAVMNGNEKIVEILLKSGANPNTAGGPRDR
ncbi:MAG: ankyrin repeat domain-containing protein [Vulcanimicrobiota bacterium]